MESRQCNPGKEGALNTGTRRPRYRQARPPALHTASVNGQRSTASATEFWLRASGIGTQPAAAAGRPCGPCGKASVVIGSARSRPRPTVTDNGLGLGPLASGFGTQPAAAAGRPCGPCGKAPVATGNLGQRSTATASVNGLGHGKAGEDEGVDLMVISGRVSDPPLRILCKFSALHYKINSVLCNMTTLHTLLPPALHTASVNGLGH